MPALGSQLKAGRDECRVVGVGGNVSILPPPRSVLHQRAWTGLAARKPMQAKLAALPFSLPRAPVQQAGPTAGPGRPLMATRVVAEAAVGLRWVVKI